MSVLRSDKSPRERRRALLALDLAGPQTRKVFQNVGTALRENTGKDGLRVRAYAVSSLGRIGGPAARAVPALLEVLAEPEPAGGGAEARRAWADLRRATADALGAIGDADALRPLARALD